MPSPFKNPSIFIEANKNPRKMSVCSEVLMGYFKKLFEVERMNRGIRSVHTCPSICGDFANLYSACWIDSLTSVLCILLDVGAQLPNTQRASFF